MHDSHKNVIVANARFTQKCDSCKCTIHTPTQKPTQGGVPSDDDEAQISPEDDLVAATESKSPHEFVLIESIMGFWFPKFLESEIGPDLAFGGSSELYTLSGSLCKVPKDLVYYFNPSELAVFANHYEGLAEKPNAEFRCTHYRNAAGQWSPDLRFQMVWIGDKAPEPGEQILLDYGYPLRPGCDPNAPEVDNWQTIVKEMTLKPASPQPEITEADSADDEAFHGIKALSAEECEYEDTAPLRPKKRRKAKPTPQVVKAGTKVAKSAAKPAAKPAKSPKSAKPASKPRKQPTPAKDCATPKRRRKATVTVVDVEETDDNGDADYEDGN